MILNPAIFTATIEAAKAKAASRPEVIRAIDRAVVEIERAAYWSFADGVLTIKSTTSGEMYKVDAAHDCPAHSKVRKHHIARLLMIRYTERLAAAPVVAKADERTELVHQIEAVWSREEWNRTHLTLQIARRFGVVSLHQVSVEHLRAIRAAQIQRIRA